MAIRSGAVNRRIERRAAQLAGRSWSWQDEAACLEEPDDLFFGPERETPTQRQRRERAAAEVCRRCPVLENCRTHALTLPEVYGVWGGTTEEQRLLVRRSLASPAA